MERDLDINTYENLRLKGLNFELSLKVADYTLMVEQTNKRIKLLTDRSSRVIKDLENAY